jgi:HEAT repeat protein
MRTVIFCVCAAASLNGQPLPPELPLPVQPYAEPYIAQAPRPDPARRPIVNQAEIQARVEAAVSRSLGSRGDKDYRSGTRYLDKGDWDKAAEAFTEVINKKGERSDGAYYWKAYALGRSGKRQEAVALLNQLETTSPKSRWLSDARALRVELQQASGQPLSQDVQNDEELKLIALNGLIDTAPERAIPVLGDLLKKSSSPRFKERALFVLAQSELPAARNILVEYAKGTGNPDLQLKAVEYLGIHRSPANAALLAEIYAANNDKEVRRRVLRAYAVSRDKARLVQVARSETDPDLRKQAVSMLGSMRAEAELMQLYAAESNRDVRQRIIHSMMAAQSPRSLVEIARKESDPELKREAVQMLSRMKSQEATDYLMELIK